MEPVNPTKGNQESSGVSAPKDAIPKTSATSSFTSQEPISPPTQTPPPQKQKESQVETSSPTAQKSPVASSSTVINTPGFLTPRSRGFRIFVDIAIAIIVIIYSIVGYLYFQNKKMKEGEVSEPREIQTQVSPTPEFSPDQIKIQNGSIVREREGADTQTLIDKDDYQSTGITGFARVVVSPDHTYLCFESWPPALEPALYVSKIDASGVAEVSPNRQGCIWNSDSKKIYYVNSSSPGSPVNIYVYDLATKLEQNLTLDFVPEGSVRRYEIVGLSGDGSKLICNYEDAGGEGVPSLTVEPVKQCEIDLQTNQLILL